MTHGKTLAWFGLFLVAFFVRAGSARAEDISGPITTTLTILNDSKLVGDVSCTVSGAACIVFGAPGITLDLNGFSMTGLGDSETGCSGGPLPGAVERSENGIFASAQRSVTIRGPGLIQRFRGAGISSSNSSGVTVTGVTISTNCLSGILVGGGSDHNFTGNVAVRNGNGTSPCGGI